MRPTGFGLGVLLAIAGCSSDSSSSPSTSDGTSEQLCVDTINNYRATIGQKPYQRWTTAEACSDNEALTDSMHAGMPHWAFQNQSQPCKESAQDECPGWPGPPSSMITSCLQAMWAEGPGPFDQGHGHYDNMSSAQYTKVSCGFYTMPDGSVWAVQNFQ